MLKNDYFKAVLISFLFSLSVLVVLPRIPVFVNSKLYKVDSYVGGYQIKIGSLNLDLSRFRSGVDVQGGDKIILKVEDFEQQDKGKYLSSLVEVVIRRLLLAGYSDFSVGIENANNGEVYILVPEFLDSSKISSLVSGSGDIEIKKLKDPNKWSAEVASELISEPSEWVSTGLTRQDIEDLRLIRNTSGQDQIQLIFTPEGKDKFKEFLKDILNKPFSINVNGSPQPIAAPVVSQSLVDQPNLDPVITGGFETNTVKDYIVQMKNPISSNLSVFVNKGIKAQLGDNFLNKCILSVLIGILVSFVFFTLKFKNYGVIGSVSLMLSLILFCALFKVFSLVINVFSIVSFVIFYTVLLEFTNLVLLNISSSSSSSKPRNLAVRQAFSVNIESLKLILVSFLSFAFVFSFYVHDNTKYFLSTLVLGALFIVFHYFYLLKTFIELFGGEDEK